MTTTHVSPMLGQRATKVSIMLTKTIFTIMSLTTEAVKVSVKKSGVRTGLDNGVAVFTCRQLLCGRHTNPL